MTGEQSIQLNQPLRGVRLSPARDEATPIETEASQPENPATDDDQARTRLERERTEQERFQQDKDERERQERAEIEHALASLHAAADGLTRRRSELLGELQQAAVQLAVAIAARLTHEKLDSDQFAIEALVRDAVRRLGVTGPVTVSLNPHDLELLTRRLGDHQPLFQDAAVQTIADESLARGDCRADSGDVSVLSTLAEHMEGIRHHLTRSLAHAEIERREAAPGDRQLRHFPDRRQTA